MTSCSNLTRHFSLQLDTISRFQDCLFPCYAFTRQPPLPNLHTSTCPTPTHSLSNSPTESRPTTTIIRQTQHSSRIVSQILEPTVVDGRAVLPLVTSHTSNTSNGRAKNRSGRANGRCSKFGWIVLREGFINGHKKCYASLPWIYGFVSTLVQSEVWLGLCRCWGGCISVWRARLTRCCAESSLG